MQNLFRANFDNGLKGGRQIMAIAVEHWRTVSHGRLTQRRMAADGELMVKPPAAQGLPHPRHLGKTMRFAELTEHRLVFIDALSERTFLPRHIDEKRRLILTLQYAGGRPAGVAGQPDVLFFNDGIEHELRRIGQFFREAYLQLIIEAVGPAGDLQTAGMTINGRTLPGPHHILQTALFADKPRQPAVSGGGQQVDGVINIGFAAAVGAEDNVQRPELQRDIPDRAKVLNTDVLNHHGSCPGNRRLPQ